MQFEAYIIKTNDSKAMVVCLVGILLLFGIVPMNMVPALREFIYLDVLAALGVFIVGIIMSKGNASLYTITDEILKVGLQNIQIGIVVYPIHELYCIDFYYDSFNGQSPYGNYTETSGEIEYGINNRISFTYRGMNITQRFHLADEQHAVQFVTMLEAYKQNDIPFTVSYNKNKV